MQAREIGFGREDQNDEVADAVDAGRIVQGFERGADLLPAAARTNERLDVVTRGNEGCDDGIHRRGLFGSKACPAVVAVRRPARGVARGARPGGWLGKRRHGVRPALVPAIGGLDLDEVQRSDIETMVNPLRPVLRNRVLALTSRLFRYFEDEGLRQQYSNPCRAVERGREQPRDRTLNRAEMLAFGRALAKAEINPVKRAVVQVATLTGLRISEVIALRWDCVDFDSGNVLLPTTKTGRRIHPSSKAALDVLNGQPMVSDYVFCIRPPKPIGYPAVRLAFLKVVKAAGLSNVRLHDLRRAFMTRAAESGISAHTLRDLLGHKTAVMADRYVRRRNAPVAQATEQVSGALAKALDAS